MTDVLAMAKQMEVPVQHIFSSIRRRGLIADADAGRGAGSLIDGDSQDGDSQLLQ
jgi:hypothetical protein